MATITQRIALTGNSEIKAAFDALGAAGQAAFSKIQQAAGAAKSVQSLAPTLDDLKIRVQAVGDAGRNFGQSFDNLSSSLLTTARSLALIGTAVAGAIVGFGLLVKGAGDAAQAIQEGAQAAGTTAQNYQALQFAAAQSGLGADKLDSILSRLNNSLGASQKSALATQQAQQKLTQEYTSGQITAAQYVQRQQDLTKNASQQITAFNQLGIATHNSDGSLRDLTDVTKDIGAAFLAMPDGAEKSSLAIQIFGRGGAQAIPLVEKLASGIGDVISQSNKLAPALTTAQIAVGNKLAVAFDTLGLAASRAKDSVLLAFAPATSALVNGLTNFIAQNRSAWEALAASIAQKIVPIVNQVLAQLQNLGANANTDFITGLIDSFIQFGKDAVAAIGIVIQAWNGLVAILQTVANAINSVFGTTFTGQTLAIVAALGIVTGAFTTIAAVIGAVITGVQLLAAGLLIFGPEGAIIVGLAALGAAIGALVVQIPSVQTAFNALVDGFNGTVQNFKDLFGIIGAEWTSLWDTITQTASAAANSILSFIQPIIDAIKSIASFGSSAGAAGAGAATQGFAGGGMVHGPGTPTSDSIFARLSRGEYVIPAKAVDFFGVGFFETIRRLGDPIKALGGNFKSLAPAMMASMALPRFANGGLVGAVANSGGGTGTPFTLVIDGNTFGGLLAPEKVASAMTQFAIKQQLRSTGKSPSWVR